MASTRNPFNWLPRPLLRRCWPALAATCLVGILLSIGVLLGDWKRVHLEAESAFRGDASRDFLILEEEIEEAVNSMGSVVDFFTILDSVDRSQFRDFVRPQITRAPGLVSLVWAPRVLDKDRARFEAAGRRLWGAGFRIFDWREQDRPSGRRAEYFPVYYRETITGPENSRIVGLDWATGLERPEALERARDTGQPAMTGELTLTGGAKVVQVNWPVYGRGAPRGTVEERRKSLRGFVGAIFEIERLIEPMLGALGAHGIDIVLRDAGALESQRPMYSRAARPIAPPRSWPGWSVVDESIRSRLRWTGTLNVGGRHWVMSLTPAVGCVGARVGSEMWEHLLLGLLTTSLVGGYLLLLMRRTDAVERVVVSRTHELRQAHDRLLAEMTERTRAEATARRLTLEVLSIQERERRHLSREMHDEAGQALTGLVLVLKLLYADVPEDQTLLRRRLQDAEALARGTEERIRLLARDLRPPALDTLGLNASLRGLCHEVARQTGVAIAYTGTEVAALPDTITICLYRVLQEALTNVVRHARASRIDVALQDDAEAVILSVKDDGQGFDTPDGNSARSPAEGIGLVGMRERLELLGGHLKIVSRPGQGTCLVAQIPLAALEETMTPPDRAPKVRED